MQYELYEQLTNNGQRIVSFCIESNNILAISSYMDKFVLDNKSKYIVVNNTPTKPINYLQLGFDHPPTEKEHYDIILECKLAKERFRRITENDFDEYYLYNDLSMRFADNIYSVAKLQTDVYFAKYDSQSI